MISFRMRKITFAAVFFGGLIITVSFAPAAPAPWGIALSRETQECAGFWPGDEFVAYHLPGGWKPYFPKYDPKTGITTLVTDIGSCDFKRKGDEEKCCSQLGYKYVSDNIGKGQKTILRDKEEFLRGMKNRVRRNP